MKLKTSRFLFSLSLLLLSQMASLKVHAQTEPNVIFEQQLKVPGPNTQQAGKAGQGADASFVITQKSTVTLTINTNESKNTFNVYVLYPDNYATYKTTGSLTKATFLKNFTKLDTGSFKTTGVLNPGSYGVVIQWSQADRDDSVPSVDVEVDAEK